MPPQPSVNNQLRTIRRSTRLITRAVRQLASELHRVEREATRETPSGKKRTLRITPKRRAQPKLQGAYMGWMRQLGPRQKARVKAVKEKWGIEAAIGAARRLVQR